MGAGIGAAFLVQGAAFGRGSEGDGKGGAVEHGAGGSAIAFAGSGDGLGASNSGMPPAGAAGSAPPSDGAAGSVAGAAADSTGSRTGSGAEATASDGALQARHAVPSATAGDTDWTGGQLAALSGAGGYDDGDWLEADDPENAEEGAGDSPRINPGIRYEAGPDGEVIHGTPGDDILIGGPGDDVIYGGAGDDYIYGGAGDDILHGGPGNDRIEGGPGNDQLYADEGDNVLIGGEGDDLLVGGPGDDWMEGGFGDDTYQPGGIQDISMEYAAGRDDGGFDSIRLGDAFMASLGPEVADISILFPGADETAVAPLSAAHAIYRMPPNIEALELLGGRPATVIGDQGDNVIVGSDAGNRLFGVGGDNRLVGGAGDDWLEGGSGNDVLIGGGGDNVLIGGGGNDTLIGGSGDDLYVFRHGDQGLGTISDPGGTNTVRFDGFAAGTSVHGLRDGDSLTLYVNDGGLYFFTPLVTIDGYGTTDASFVVQINGTVWAAEELMV